MWQIMMTQTFEKWFDALGDNDRARVLAALMVLRVKGPQLPRPYADTVKGSRYNNMKELRIQSRGSRFGSSMPLIRSAWAYCFVLATRRVMKNAFTM